MTLDDRPRFRRILLELASVYHAKLDEGREARYWQALADVKIDAFEQACALAEQRAGTGSCRFFPLPGVLRELAQETEQERPVAATAETYAALEAGERCCRTCGDTGWAYVTRAGEVCDEPPIGTHAGHAVRPCPCRATNHLYQATRHRRPSLVRGPRWDG